MSGVADIKLLEAKIKEDPKNSNEITKIIAFMDHGDRSTCHAAVKSLRRLFLYFAEKGDLKVPTNKEDKNPLEKYTSWLWSKYVSFLSTVVEWIAHDDENTQVIALRTLMEIVTRQSTLQGIQGGDSFGNGTFVRFLKKILLSSDLKGELLNVFKGEFLEAYIDVQYYTMKNMAKILDTHSSPILVRNSLVLLNSVEVPDAPEENLSDFLVRPTDLSDEVKEEVEEVEYDSDDEEESNENNKRPRTNDTKLNPTKKSRKSNPLLNGSEHKRVFSACWIALLKHPLSEDMYKSVLAKFPEDVMPNLSDPLLLADFFTDSYNVGGITSLLALNSLFELIHHYNFDYPDFFPKLYKLLADDTILRSKYRKRFFKLLALFLSSTNLPAYMIASFAKRFSRLTLTAEPGAILFIIPCVYNLVLRHKECIQLIHRSTAQSVADRAAEKRELLKMKNSIDIQAAEISKNAKHIELKDGHDPFDNNTDDPAKSNALQSSFWEIYTLQNHYNANVSTKAKIFEEKLRSQMLDLSNDFDITYGTLIEQGIKRREKQQVPLAYENSNSVFNRDDIFSKVFSF